MRPPDGSGFATTIQPGDVEVPPDATPILLEEPIRLASPFLVHGRVLGTDGAAVGEAVVRAYARILAGGAPLSIEIGQATADGAGAYLLLVPSQFTP